MRNTMLLLFLCFCLTALGQDFRNAKFGMSAEDVRATERIEMKRNGYFLFGCCEDIGGLSLTVAYSFNESFEFKTGFYNKASDNVQGAISDFQKMVGMLKKKYGEPIEEAMSWSSEQDRVVYADNPSYHGYCIERGVMKPIVVWENNGTLIVCQIVKNDALYTMSVAYAKKEAGEVDVSKL